MPAATVANRRGGGVSPEKSENDSFWVQRASELVTLWIIYYCMI